MDNDMKYLVAVLLILVASPARGDPHITPSAKYDHEFPGEIIVTEMPSEAKLRKLCEGFGATFNKSTAIACAFAHRGKCFIFTIDPIEMAYTSYTWEQVMRHERAHCNGWPSDHRN
jgi:hypothetical protein